MNSKEIGNRPRRYTPASPEDAQATLERLLVMNVSETAAYMLREMFFKNDFGILSFAKMFQDGVTVITQKDIDQATERAAKNYKKLVIHEGKKGMSLGFGMHKIQRWGVELSEKQIAYHAKDEEPDQIVALDFNLRNQAFQIFPDVLYTLSSEMLKAEVITLPSPKEEG